MKVDRRAVTSRSEWLQWRRGYLCASEIAAVAGYDEYRTALSVYAEKTGLFTSTTDTPTMRRGRNFEDAAVAYLVEERPQLRVINPHVFLMEQDHRLGATPDRLIEDPDRPGITNCQIKTVARPTFEKWDGVAPAGYTLQVAAENMLLDAVHGILCVLVVGTFDAEIAIFDIPRHEAAEAKIREIADEFWYNVDNGLRPAPDYSRDAETIAGLYPKVLETDPLDLSNDNRLPEVLLERARLKKEIEASQAKLASLETEIKAKIGDHEKALLPGWRITWKEQHRKEYIVAATTYRKLTITDLRDRKNGT
jgi:putative phage-type endonuclease